MNDVAEVAASVEARLRYLARIREIEAIPWPKRTIEEIGWLAMLKRAIRTESVR